jgi:hypothetical protein
MNNRYFSILFLLMSLVITLVIGSFYNIEGLSVGSVSIADINYIYGKLIDYNNTYYSKNYNLTTSKEFIDYYINMEDKLKTDPNGNKIFSKIKEIANS